MKQFKMRISILLAASLLLVSLAGCGAGSKSEGTGNESSSSDSSTAAEETTFSYSKGIDENGYWEGIKALDYVEIFDYKAMTIPSDVHTVKDEDLQKQIDSMLASYAEKKEVKDRDVKDGDTLNIDYVGSVGGVEFDGGSTGGKGAEVTIGVTSYVDDFLQQLIGHKPGETINVEVTFPEDYGQDELNGKDAVFVTTINHIVETVEQELTDEFVEKNLTETYSWKTVDEVKTAIGEDLKTQAVNAYIKNYFATEVKIDSVPEFISQYQEDAMVDYYQKSAESYGVSLEEFLSSYVGVSSLDDLISQNATQNEQNARYYLVSQAIAEDAGITITEDDLKAYFSKYVGKDDYSEYETQYGLPYVKQNVICQQVIDLIMENATLA